MNCNPFFIAVLAAASFGISSVHAASVLTDTFSYANGSSLVGAAASPWATHSGTAGQVDVTTGVINLTSADSEDINAPLSDAPYTVGKLTATFDVNFGALPTAGGTYFAHFMSTTTVFRAKLFASTTGAAAGTFRLGVSGNANTGFVNVGSDLSLGTTYTVTMVFDMDALSTSLSVNSGATSLGTATATDTVTAIPINLFGFREASGMGTMTVDNLNVNYTVPEPASALLGAFGLLGLLRRRR